MANFVTTAVLGSTGYVGLELINILSKHPRVQIKFLGSDSFPGDDIRKFDQRIKNDSLPSLELLDNINSINVDVIFLALPHGVSHKYVKTNINKSKIIDLSADFRLDDIQVYKKNYEKEHSCPNILNDFVYGLSEINYSKIKKSNNIAVPGCYPTSVLLPHIPLFKENLIKTDNIIIDSKSGYSGAGKKFDQNNINNNNNLNFYNYNTNQHRHICEIYQELSKHSHSKINFSFNPHILPIFRGMMSTLYCELQNNIELKNLYQSLNSFYHNSNFVHLINEELRADFFKVQYTNHCYIKFFKHYDASKIIIVSIIDNLLKGASGQAIQCMNIMFGLNENIGLENLKSE